ncbi:MAG TPA: Rieske (2Fe-2S) protein [bacterium]|nr:Rieske (2Fe-2S) protein [bacterium]
MKDTKDPSEHIHMPDKRDFMRTVFTGGFMLWIGAFLYPVYRYLKPRVEEDTANAVQSVVAGKVADFDKVRAKLIKFGSKPVLLLKNDAGELVALGATCKHLGCTVQYVPDKNHIFCGCHGGTYDLTGKNIAGPPPAPLDKFKVVTNGDEIVIHRV